MACLEENHVQKEFEHSFSCLNSFSQLENGLKQLCRLNFKQEKSFILFLEKMKLQTSLNLASYLI